MKERAEAKTNQSAWRRRGRAAAWIALVVAGIVVEQFILIGPSLLGGKVLLPLDYLALPGVYLPSPPHMAPIVPHNQVYSDLVFIEATSRQFIVSEYHAGRWPLWTPNFFCGSPFIYSEFSPFKILQYCSASPLAYAWPPFFLAIFTGLGMYFFCRRVLLVGPWPATITAWCWPLTGFFIFWMGYGLPLSIGWLPWILWAVNAVIRRTSRWGGFWLAVATGLTMVSGQFDTGAQVLLVSGLYAIWCFIDEYGRRCFTRQVVPALATVVVGWGLGFALASVHLLPILEYSRSSSRLERRRQGETERPPIGMEALPQIVLPDMYGSWQQGYLWAPPTDEKGRPLEGNQLESPAATYSGLLATLLLAPLAWCSRRHRSINVFWTLLAVLGVSWSLNLPGIAQFLQLPGINMLSHNRFVFATSFCIVAMMAVGLDVLWRGEVRWRWWFWGPVTMAAVLLLWCGYCSVALPTDIANKIIELRQNISQGTQYLGLPDLKAVDRVRDTFILTFSVATVLCILSLGGWALIGLGVTSRRWFLPVLSALLLADLLWFAYGRVSQCDPALYFPPIPALEQVAKAAPGRIIGAHCLPPMLAQSHNLRDVRGYDAVDPVRIVELLQIAADPRVHPSPQYAATQWIAPKIVGFPSASEIQLHPILDMLNVHYVIFRGTPPPQFNLNPEFSSLDYWVMKNPRVLPRVFVPERVEVAADKQERLAKLSADNFNPRQVAYVEEPVELPAKCRGAAKIAEEIPTRVKVSLDMQTPGLVVLADRWDAGWHAYCDGKALPILQTNHALRGVVVPAGKGTIEFRYEPSGFAWGLRLCAMASLALTVWAAAVVWMSRADRRAANPTPANDSSPARKGRG
jgi:hypothetical protein